MYSRSNGKFNTDAIFSWKNCDYAVDVYWTYRTINGSVKFFKQKEKNTRHEVCKSTINNWIESRNYDEKNSWYFRIRRIRDDNC